MDLQTAAFTTYVLVTTFTPGPNNLSATAAGSAIGYQRSLSFLLGIAAGFFLTMLVAGLFNAAIQGAFAPVIPWLKWLGFAYMLYLAVSLFLHGKADKGSSPAAATNTVTPAGSVAGPTAVEVRGFSFGSGLLLQLINVKVILYGITIYGMFPTILLGSWQKAVLSSLGLALVGFTSINLWCLTGTAISRLLGSGKKMLAFNLVLAALLAWSAILMVAE
ncbi:MAG: LysE family transporter [Spirochaetota bacterium]